MTNFNVTVTSSAHGTTDPVPAVYVVAANGTKVLEAVPAQGYVFDGWTIDGVHKTFTNPYTFTITANVTINANFKLFVANDGSESYYYYKKYYAPITSGGL
jgi:uncharacterized repeat protein (TIGR02543 family)